MKVIDKIKETGKKIKDKLDAFERCDSKEDFKEFFKKKNKESDDSNVE